ncbi:hypothetical protein [Calothrix sp. CCY 0018]|uniref:hypothetical protein n=1 Tax=Calothrix sp. CCY 0018 TaxID=3103864 RepID=UPI0039C6B5E8
MSNNRRRDFNADYSQPGQLATQQQLAQMLQSAQQQQYQQHQYPNQQPTTINVEPTAMQREQVTVQHVNSASRPDVNRVPEIYVPVTDIWKAHRFHPHNNLRYFWYIFYWLKDVISSPVGIALVMLWLGIGGINFMLNGSYSGPGYVQNQEIKMTPDNLPNLTPVLDIVD